jgi:hypothetical protein
MSVKIPIVSTFDPAGIEKAVNQFKKLETSSQKAQFAMKKAFLPATAALAGLAVAAVSAAKAAAQDQAAQAQLANQLKNTTNATEAQIKANEEFISTLSMSAAVADDELRPALANLVRGTGDLGKAQNLLKLSLDVAAGTGKNLAEVSDAVSKAFGGNTKAIKSLSPELFALIKDGASADQVMTQLAKTFGGAAAASANSAEGQFRKFGIAMDELKESIGTALLPVATKFIGFLTDLANFASRNTWLIVGIGTAIGVITTAIIGVNIAFKAYRAAALLTQGVNFLLATSFTAVQVSTVVGIATAVAAAAALAVYVTKIKGIQAELGSTPKTGGTLIGPQLTPEQFDKMDKAFKATQKLGGGVDTMKQKIEAARKELQDKFSKALDDATQKLQKAKDAYNGFAKDISSSLTGNTSFSAVYEAGKETGQSFIAGITEQTSTVKQFAQKVQVLLKNGLSEKALQQVLNAGLEAGSAIADQLILGGSDAIKQTNDLLQSLQDLADSVGVEAADNFYLAGMTQGEALVAGIESVIANYEGILKNPNLTLKQLMGLSGQFDTDAAFAGITGATDIAAPSAEGLSASIGEFMAQRQVGMAQQGYTINVNGGLDSSAAIGQAVVNAIRSFNRTNGPAQIAVSSY